MQRKRFIFAFFSIFVIITVSSCYHTPVSTYPPASKNARDLKGLYSGTVDRNGIITLSVIGKGIAPESAISKGQALLLAERAAINDGYRRLAEKIMGVYIEAYSTMGTQSIDFDIIQTETHTSLRGAEILKVQEARYGIVEAYMQAKIYFDPEKQNCQ